MTDSAAYHAWYATPRGAWIAGRELALLDELLRPRPGESVLDARSGASSPYACAGPDPSRAAL